jgi:hypothetical protein
MRSFNQQDLEDIRIVLNEQFDLIQRLKPYIAIQVRPSYNDLKEIYEDILDCNHVMMEIIDGPKGGIEKIVERNA